MLNNTGRDLNCSQACPRATAWLAAIAALLAATAVSAAEPTAEPEAKPARQEIFKDWRIQCEKPEGDEEHCHIFQSVVLKEGNRRLLHLGVGYVPDQEDQVVAIFTLPLGISLPPGITLQVDEGESMRLPVEHCIPQGCRVLVPLDAKLLGTLKAGNKATVTFSDTARQPVGVPVSLQGFTAALNALK